MNTYDEDLLSEVASMLQIRPWSLRELSLRFEKSERTIKRWLIELRRRGFRVVRDGITVECPYYVAGAVPEASRQQSFSGIS
jgi:hypothetical protein